MSLSLKVHVHVDTNLLVLEARSDLEQIVLCHKRNGLNKYSSVQVDLEVVQVVVV